MANGRVRRVRCQSIPDRRSGKKDRVGASHNPPQPRDLFLEECRGSSLSSEYLLYPPSDLVGMHHPVLVLGPAVVVEVSIYCNLMQFRASRYLNQKEIPFFAVPLEVSSVVLTRGKTRGLIASISWLSTLWTRSCSTGIPAKSWGYLGGVPSGFGSFTPTTKTPPCVFAKAHTSAA